MENCPSTVHTGLETDFMSRLLYYRTIKLIALFFL